MSLDPSLNPREIGRHAVEGIKEGATGGDRAWAKLTPEQKTAVRAKTATKGVAVIFWAVLGLGVAASVAVHWAKFWYVPAVAGLLLAFICSSVTRQEFDRQAKELAQ